MQVYGYCIIKDGQQAKIRYPKDGAVGEVSGRSFHNGRFVQKLRQAASQLSNVTVRQAIAKRLLNGESSRRAVVLGQTLLSLKHLLVASLCIVSTNWQKLPYSSSTTDLSTNQQVAPRSAFPPLPPFPSKEAYIKQD